jgi:hypothetical protein
MKVKYYDRSWRSRRSLYDRRQSGGGPEAHRRARRPPRHEEPPIGGAALRRGLSREAAARNPTVCLALIGMTDRTHFNCAPVVLVVEDETLLRLKADEFLEDAGFEVVDAADAGEALQIMAARPDVTVPFTDIELPGDLDGIEPARLGEFAGMSEEELASI